MTVQAFFVSDMVGYPENQFSRIVALIKYIPNSKFIHIAHVIHYNDMSSNSICIQVYSMFLW